MENIGIKRLLRLEDYIIQTSLATINLDDEYALYESILQKVFSGEVDDIFISENLDDVDEYEKNEIMKLARKYSSLCFYQGDYDNWIDSPDGITALNPASICKKLLNDYDYLIRLAKNGKEDLLRFLLKFQNTDIAKRGSVISALRNLFYSDEVLENILIEMSKEDGKYNAFSDDKKLILFNYADGVLYKELDNKEVEITDVNELEKEIVEGFIGPLELDKNKKDIIKKISNENFLSIIEDINRDYLEKYFGYKK